MRFDLDRIEEIRIDNFKGGKGHVVARMGINGNEKYMIFRLPVGSTIGKHKHETNMEVQFYIAGKGIVYCDGKEEIVGPGICHVCPKGSTHEVINTGDEDIVMYCSVTDC